MHDPDDLLAPLVGLAPPASLATLEDDVAAAIAGRAADAVALRRAGAFSVIGALALGLGGGFAVTGGAAPAQAAAPIGVDVALAPSTLLLGR